MNEYSTITLLLIAATAIIFTGIGFVVGYLLGLRSKQAFRFAINMTATQVSGIVLFTVYNRWLTNTPDTIVNVGILSLIGGEAVGGLFTRITDKTLDKAIDRAKK